MAMVKSKNVGSRIFNVVNCLFFAAIMIVCILPVWHVFCASFSNASWVMNQSGMIWHVQDFNLTGYKLVFADNNIWTGYLNTFIYVIGTTALGMFLTVMAAYALSRKDFIWANPLMLIISFTMLFSGGLVPSYIMWTTTFHIKNTIWAYILPNFLLGAFNIILVRTFFSTSIPNDIYEAAKIDGAGYPTIYWKIVLPLGKPILVTIGLFAGLSYWNDWTNGLYYVNQSDMLSIQALLNRMIQDIQALAAHSTADSGALMQIPQVSIRMAIAFVAILPILLVYPFLQKYFASGIMLGAVKG